MSTREGGKVKGQVPGEEEGNREEKIPGLGK